MWKFENDEIIVHHNAGFFSCSSVRLEAVITYYNKFKSLPRIVNSTNQFNLYKLKDSNEDISHHFFRTGENSEGFPSCPVDYDNSYQWHNFKDLNYVSIVPFIKKYFSPADEIKNQISLMEDKYKLDYNNICVLFYRGLDKRTECTIPTYGQVLEQGHEIARTNPDVRFLIQSDEEEFIEAAIAEFPNAIVFRDETRFAPRQNSSVDLLYRETNENLKYVKLFLSIVHIMSKARFLICNSGNISIWTCLFRGNAENVHQFIENRFV